MFLFCLVFAMSLCVSVYLCFVVTCWERTDLLALVCGVYYEFVTFPLVSWVRLIVSIPDLCTLTYFVGRLTCFNQHWASSVDYIICHESFTQSIVCTYVNKKHL